ncbi:hypothetical protein CXB51_028643 [Gossypium anomalum]|uniref:Uncharacterized protein n=1 Tax=Gossypium anomalum TaxID=47600 RepID=A0A8J5Y7F6_9ROSI|nr:hypothetical protein CXB51_028643 [Gossypium anomalum]
MGRLRFRDLSLFNIVLLGRQVWRLTNHKNTLCYHVLSSKYFPNDDVFHPKAVNKPAYSWTCILYAINALESGFGWQIGDGLKASFNDNQNGLVSELWMPNSCEWDRGRMGELYGDMLIDQIFAFSLVQNRLPGRIRVGHDLLLTNVKVASVFHGSSRECICSKIREESTIHALKDCPKTRAVFSFGGLDGRLLDDDYVRCINWLEDATRKEEDARIVWERAISLEDDFEVFNLTNVPLLAKTPRLQKWNKSLNAFVKINVDVVIVNNSVGGFAMYRETRMNVEWADAEALRERIVWGYNNNIMREIFEFDYESLVKNYRDDIN